MKTLPIRRDRRAFYPSKFGTWIGICVLTAAAYAAIVLFSPGDKLPEPHAAVTATAPAKPPIPSRPRSSAPFPAIKAPASAPVDTAEPVPMV